LFDYYRFSSRVYGTIVELDEASSWLVYWQSDPLRLERERRRARGNRASGKTGFLRLDWLNALIRRVFKRGPDGEWRPATDRECRRWARETGSRRGVRPGSASKPNGAEEPGIERIRGCFPAWKRRCRPGTLTSQWWRKRRCERAKGRAEIPAPAGR